MEETPVRLADLGAEPSFDSDKKAEEPSSQMVDITTPDPPAGTYRLYRRRFIGLVALVSYPLR
jgi:hypothetical protein